MKMRMLLAASAALGLTMAASSASAITAIVAPGVPVVNDLYGTTLPSFGQVMLEDFDAINSPFTTFTGNVITTTPNPVDTSAPPPYTGPGAVVVTGVTGTVDPTAYASVQANQTSTLSVAAGYYLTGFSFYMGSPDDFNKITFKMANGATQTLTGTAIWGGVPDGNGDRSAGYRVYYDFSGAKVTSIDFESVGANAFEFDGLAGTVTAVPEPGTWALMIMGFGGAGAMIRRRKAALA